MSVSKRISIYYLVAAVFLLAACSMPSFGGRTPTPIPQGAVLTPIEPSALDLSAVQPTNTPFVPTPTATFTPADQAGLDQANMPPANNPLADTRWELQAFDEAGSEPASVIAGSDLSLEFAADGSLSGSGGCNLFAGTYRVDNHTLSFGAIAQTEMACADAALDRQEQRFLDALKSASMFQVTADRLALAYNGLRGALIFARRDLAGGDGLCSIQLQGSRGQWLCRSAGYGFEVQFPAAGILREQTPDSARIDLAHEMGTNLSEKYLDINTAEDAETCASPVAAGYAPGTLPSEQVTLNGIEFTRQEGQDSGAGSSYEWTAYSTQRGGVCLSLTFVLHSVRVDVDPPLPDFDKAQESEIFEEIASTLRWLVESPPATAAAPSAVLPSTAGAERIRFASGETSGRVSGRLAASEARVYVLRAARGQTMTVSLNFDNGEAALLVWGANGSVLLSESAATTRFEGLLPATQDYYIQVKGRPGGSTEYRLRVTIPALESGSGASSSGTERIRFGRGATSGRVSDHLAAGASQLYVLRALRGQTMTVDLTFTNGDAILAVWGANGVVLMSSASGSSHFEGYLAYTQDYFIQVIGRDSGGTDFHMKVTIPPL